MLYQNFHFFCFIKLTIIFIHTQLVQFNSNATYKMSYYRLKKLVIEEVPHRRPGRVIAACGVTEGEGQVNILLVWCGLDQLQHAVCVCVCE